jgi:hypothetical protein
MTHESRWEINALSAFLRDSSYLSRLSALKAAEKANRIARVRLKANPHRKKFQSIFGILVLAAHDVRRSNICYKGRAGVATRIQE